MQRIIEALKENERNVRNLNDAIQEVNIELDSEYSDTFGIIKHEGSIEFIFDRNRYFIKNIDIINESKGKGKDSYIDSIYELLKKEILMGI